MPARLPLPLGLAIAVVAVGACAALGARFTLRTMRADPGWYPGLSKPAWTPSPRRIRGVWTALYVLIAVAAALVWSEGLDLRFTYALLLNLVLNAGWSWIFFGLRSPGGALAEIVVLEVTCVALVPLAARSSTAAAALLLPYALWVAFATILNAVIFRRNRRVRSARRASE